MLYPPRTFAAHDVQTFDPNLCGPDVSCLDARLELSSCRDDKPTSTRTENEMTRGRFLAAALATTTVAGVLLAMPARAATLDVNISGGSVLSGTEVFTVGTDSAFVAITSTPNVLSGANPHFLSAAAGSVTFNINAADVTPPLDGLRLLVQDCTSEDPATCSAGETLTYSISTAAPAVTLGTLNRTAFNPLNANSSRASVTLPYTLGASASAVTVEVLNAANTIVRTFAQGPQRKGTQSISWDGRVTDGSVAADGSYRLRVRASSNPTSPVATSPLVLVDRTAATRVSGSTTLYVFPKAGAYKPVAPIKLTANESVKARLSISNATGAVVRTVDFTTATKTFAFNWNAKTLGGALVPVGRYRYTFVLTNAVGLQTTASYYVYVDGRKWYAGVAKSKELIPDSKMLGAKFFYQYCNLAGSYTDPAAWKGAHFLESHTKCKNSKGVLVPVDDSFAGISYGYTLPGTNLNTATTRTQVTLKVIGGATPGHKGSTAATVFLTKNDDEFAPEDLGTAYKTHIGSTADLSKFGNGSRVKWLVFTDNNDWYDMRRYILTWTTSTLR